jgi:hypothetical protein
VFHLYCFHAQINLTSCCTENTEVYNIICDSLNLTPKPNNGTLRLPLKPVGIHTPQTYPEEPSDPVTPLPPPSPASSTEEGEPDTVIEISPIEVSSAADPNEKPPTMVGVDAPDASVDRPVVEDGGQATDKNKDIWKWLKGKVDDIKVWISGLVGGDETNNNE